MHYSRRATPALTYHCSHFCNPSSLSLVTDMSSSRSNTIN